MSGFVLVVAMSLAILALLALAVSVVAFLVQTSRHRPARRWIMTAGASLILVLVFGSLSNAVSRQSGLPVALLAPHTPHKRPSSDRGVVRGLYPTMLYRESRSPMSQTEQ